MNLATMMSEAFETAEESRHSSVVIEQFGQVDKPGQPLCDHCHLRISKAPCTCVQRSCADCTAYFPEQQMVERNDGRKCCPACVAKANRIAEERRQMEMFCAQDRLF